MVDNISVAIDTGGTFSDVVSYDPETGMIKTLKTPSTPEKPHEALINGLNKSGYGSAIERIVHGTTLASNALVERKGGEISYITTKGFRDVPYIQRIDRKGHYDLTWSKPPALVRRKNSFEVTEKVSYKGEVLQDLNRDELKKVVDTIKERKIEAIAVCFLFSYVNPVHEVAAKQIIQEMYPEAFLSISSEVYPRWKEYERVTTTLADVYLKSIMSKYAEAIKTSLKENNFTDNFTFMKTNGGQMSLDSIRQFPVQTLNSGPAAGVISSLYFGKLYGYKNIITYDMGGTTCDIAAIINDEVQYTASFEIEYGVPIQIPMVDVKAIGAGGGSLAYVDKGGMLQVGPQSAGADPGPVCYNKGNATSTVTDANLLLGYLNPEKPLGGEVRLHKDLAEKAVKQLGEKLGMELYDTASAIVKIADNNMISAFTSFMTRRGLDPREFVFFAFGGAGPMHAGIMMDELTIDKVIVPPHPGVFSALGLLMADARVDSQRMIQMSSNRYDLDKLKAAFDGLQASCLKEMQDQGFKDVKPEDLASLTSIEMRYFGQNYEVDTPISMGDISGQNIDNLFEKFHRAHETMYGYRIENEIIELLTAKMIMTKKIEKPQLKDKVSKAELGVEGMRDAYFNDKFIPTKIYDREQIPVGTKLEGPAIIEEETATTVISPGFTFSIGKYGDIVITKTAA